MIHSWLSRTFPVILEAGRYAPGAINILADYNVPRGAINNFFGLEAHAAMHSNPALWRHYFMHYIIMALIDGANY